MPEASSRYVFVYGTLRRGGVNDITRLDPAPEFVGEGQVQGVLYQLGWYPGLRLGGGEAAPVRGEVYRISAQLEALLDRIEEVQDGPHSEYFKRVVPIRVQGQSLACLLYEINPQRTQGQPRIGQGDWIAFRKS